MKTKFPFITLVAATAIAFATDHVADGHVAIKHGLTLAGARLVLDAAKNHARQHHAPGGAIAIVDEGGQLLAFERLDGTFPGSPDISIGKARTAAAFKKPTKDFEDVIAKGRFAMTALPNFTPLQGGIPLFHEGHVVGAIGVSGAMSAEQDEQIARAGADALNEGNGKAQ